MQSNRSTQTILFQPPHDLSHLKVHGGHEEMFLPVSFEYLMILKFALIDEIHLHRSMGPGHQK